MTLQLKYDHAVKMITRINTKKKHDKRELKQWRKFAKDLAQRLNASDKRYGNI